MEDVTRVGGLVVTDRPQISVELLAGRMIEITVSRIGDDFSSVQTDIIIFPAEVGKDVAKAILELLKK